MGIFVDSVLPQFRLFCEERIFPQNYDFLVPLETKGILLLNQVLRLHPDHRGHVRFRRSFDFLSSAELSGKRIALIDDTVLLGRTLSSAAEELQQRGAGRVDKYACMLIDRPEYLKSTDDLRAARDNTKDVVTTYVFGQSEYDDLLEELSQLTMQERPGFPDHLIFHMRLGSPCAPESLAEILAQYGTLMEYPRRSGSRDYSLHYPAFRPPLGFYATEDGPCKVRFRVARDGESIAVTPGNFPSVRDLQSALDQDPYATRFYEILRGASWSGASESLNQYEAFTIAQRAKMVAALLNRLNEEHVQIAKSDIRLDDVALRGYFGPVVAKQISGVVTETVQECLTESARWWQPDRPTSENDARDIFTITGTLLSRIDAAYVEANVGASRMRWRSKGLRIGELSVQTRIPREDTSIGVELLGDRGHVVPFQEQFGDHGMQRGYRTTEIGGRRLVLGHGSHGTATR